MRAKLEEAIAPRQNARKRLHAHHRADLRDTEHAVRERDDSFFRPVRHRERALLGERGEHLEHARAAEFFERPANAAPLSFGVDLLQVGDETLDISRLCPGLERQRDGRNDALALDVAHHLGGHFELLTGRRVRQLDGHFAADRQFLAVDRHEQSGGREIARARCERLPGRSLHLHHHAHRRSLGTRAEGPFIRIAIDADPRSGVGIGGSLGTRSVEIEGVVVDVDLAKLIVGGTNDDVVIDRLLCRFHDCAIGAFDERLEPAAQFRCRIEKLHRNAIACGVHHLGHQHQLLAGEAGFH